MADKQDYNDDYQFTDLDSPGTDPFDTENEEKPAAEIPVQKEGDGRNRVIRNAVIAVIIFFLALLLYKFFTARKSTEPAVIAPPPKTAPAVATLPPAPAIQKPVETAPVVAPAEIQEIDQKMNALDLNQQNLRTDLNNLSNQLNSISTNISDISAQIAKISQTVETLSATVSQQSATIAILETRLEKPKPIAKPRIRHHYAPAPVFYIQAVVPGRAWIISTTGTTLTVREGSSVPGYGIVKLIDAQQGRVLTGSGRIIKFSQEDS